MAKEEIQYVWSDKKRTLFGLPLSFTRYFLTETKFITRKGFLSLEEDELELYKVVDKKMQLSLGQRLFGCGTIVLYVKDTDTPVKEVLSVKAPRRVAQLIDKYVDQQRDRFHIRGRDMMGATHRDYLDESDDMEDEVEYDDAE
ncbi:PH domain-containing protein [Ruminococcus champanellensis]|uniref:PH domain-containing protein n=1 Tax=Ruminococcus champanellensis TaxID=1161942 RepID=UPI002E793107|nr:PH domain-containing protein [Ruminococcus champanellensis]MED9890927.1 PH domain-containing protein [Ruminococcus champanellensis]